MKAKKIISIISVIVVAVLIVYGYKLYSDIFGSNTSFEQAKVGINIPTNSNFADVKKIIAPYIKDISKFEMVADKKSYSSNIKAGHFVLKRKMNSNDLINALRQNVPVKVAFNNQERIEDLAGRISQEIEADSLLLLKSFKDNEFLEKNGLNESNVLSLFVPNSYEFFWNTSADQFRDKMAKEYRKFWNADRLAKAEKLNLTPLQVSAVAAIVHKETVMSNERPRVAGVYLNRIQKGMKLEADPTVIYAVKKNANDWKLVIKRVLNKDLATDSPYNTYFNYGIPPGPIAMPDISAIDAVLNPEKHDYIYFCASVINFGYHEFAVTGAQHEANRRKYVAWISKQGIKR